MSLPQEFFAFIRGVRTVTEAGLKLQQETFQQILQSYNFKSMIENVIIATERSNHIINKKSEEFFESINETGENLHSLADSVNQFITHSLSTSFKDARTIKPGQDPESETDQNIIKKIDQEITLTPNDKDLLKKIDVEQMEKSKAVPVAAAVSLHVASKTEDDKPKESKKEELENKKKLDDSKQSDTEKD